MFPPCRLLPVLMVSSPLRLYSVGVGREQTIYTGLWKDSKAVTRLNEIYNMTLKTLLTFPTDYYYRQTLEATLRERIRLLNEAPETVVETAFGEGLLEQVVQQAGEEQLLVDSMVEWKPWESLENPPPQGQWDL